MKTAPDITPLSRRLAALAFVSAVALLVTGLSAGCGKEAKRPEPPAPLAAPIEVVRQAKMALNTEAVGTVRSRLTSAMASKIPGQITAFPAREGMHVAAGQALVEIDNREAAAGLKRAEAALAEAEKALEEVIGSIRAAEAARNAADAAAALAASTLKRNKELFDAGAINRQEFEEIEARNKMAAADAERAAQNLAAARTKQPQVLARIEQAKAELAAATVGLGYARIAAPFDGLVTTRNAEAGDMAMPGLPLVTVEDDKHYRLEAELGESLAGRVQPGQEVRVKIDSLGGREFAGKVAEVVPAVAAGSRSFTVKIDLPATDALRSGLFGRAFIPAGEREALTVPDGAVIERGQLTGVFVLDETCAARWRLIKTGAGTAGRVEVLAGLSAGETVVTGSLDKVAEGVRVAR